MASGPTTPRDPYDVLGVGRDADDGQIKKAFRRLARELHPDVNRHDPEAEEKFKQAAEAYEILSDPERRATFDRFGHEGLRSGGWAPRADQFGSLGDLFDAFFGGGGPFGGRAGPRQGADVAAQVDIDLADAASGVSPEVSFDAVAVCEHCRGNGAEPGTPIETCERCGGAGQLQMVSRTALGQMVRTVVCDACRGDGRVPRTPCRECRGEGRRASRTALTVDVPAGIADGQRIRVTGRGHAGEPGAPPGDLYVLVRVRPHPQLLRDGDDLVAVLDVPAPLAALGTTLPVTSLDGPVDVEVPAGTQPGETLTLKARGMPVLQRSGRFGDLRVVVNVVIPRRLDKEQRDLVRRLAASMTDENLRGDESMAAKLRRLLHV